MMQASRTTAQSGLAARGLAERTGAAGRRMEGLARFLDEQRWDWERQAVMHVLITRTTPRVRGHWH